MKEAPASNRHPTLKKTPSIYQPPKTDKHDEQWSETALQAFQDLSARPHQKTDITNWPDNTQQSGDTSTTSSLMAKSHAMQQRFQELENTFCQLITDTWLHQADLLRMNNWFNKSEGQLLTTRALYKDTSQNVLNYIMKPMTTFLACDRRQQSKQLNSRQHLQKWQAIETLQMLLSHPQTAFNLIRCPFNH